MTDPHETARVLNGLVQTCKDGEAGFRTCAKAVSSPGLQRLLEARAEECATSAQKLQGLVLELGGIPEEHTSVGEDIHRRWIEFKALVSGEDDNAIVDECERGEGVAMENYEKALDQALPPAIRKIIQSQHARVIRNHGQLRSLGDSGRL